MLSDTLRRALLPPSLAMTRRLLGGKLDPVAMRSGIARVEKLLGDDAGEAVRIAVQIEQCAATWIDMPEARADHVILYLHGGGFIFETPGLHGAFLTRLCRDTANRGLMLHYRLAPEFPYPAATDDCLAAYRYLLASGYASDKIVIAGDSAGGNLTLVTLLRIREAGLPLPAGAIVLSPLTDATGSSDSFQRNAAHDPMFDGASLDVVLGHYLPNVGQRSQAWASPLLGDLQGLPPIHIVVGSSELLLDDAVRFAVKCPSATLDVWHDMPHVFPLLSFLPAAQLANTRLERSIAAMQSGVPALDAVLHPAQKMKLTLPKDEVATLVLSGIYLMLALLSLALVVGNLATGWLPPRYNLLFGGGFGLAVLLFLCEKLKRG